MDQSIFKQIETELIYRAGSQDRFKARLADVVESSVRYVLDGEDDLSCLEGCEKSVFGVKFEKRFTQAFDLPRKRTKSQTLLDTQIAGFDIDIKTTLGGKTWMIPPEAHGHWCLLLQVDHRRSSFGLGALCIGDDVITKGKNRDRKASVSAAGRAAIEWIVADHPYRIHRHYSHNLFGSA